MSGYRRGMATKTKSTNAAVLTALADGPASAAELKKAAHLDDAQWDEQLAKMKARLWVTEDDSGRTTKYALTDFGRGVLSSRYS